MAFLESASFGVFLTCLSYYIGLKIKKLGKNNALLNPLAIATILIIFFLLLTGIPLENYMQGGRIVSFFIAPATIALILNLYKNLDLLKKNALAIILGVFAGIIVNALIVVILTKAFRLGPYLSISILPKSITTAIGQAFSASYGGNPNISMVAIILTGITGAILAKPVFQLFKITDPIAIGTSLGSTSHAVGTGRALEYGEVQGSMAGLSIALAGILSVLILPIFVQFL